MKLFRRKTLAEAKLELAALNTLISKMSSISDKAFFKAVKLELYIKKLENKNRSHLTVIESKERFRK